MLNPDEVITTMAQQREQECAAGVAHYMLRKACEARAVDLYHALSHFSDYGPVAVLIKEIDDASH
jgi:hypothetical protein